MEKNLFAVIDLEATCNKEGLEPAVPVEKMETIEVGIALIDLDTKTIISTFESKVCPVFVDNVTPFCTKLTGISKEDLEQAPDFEDTMQHVDDWLRSFTHKKVTWGSWGKSDCNQIKQDCIRHSTTNNPVFVENLGAHLNMKRMFIKQNKFYYKEKRVRKEQGLKRALGLCDMEFEGRHHSALADAQNAARLICEGHLKINEEEITKYSRTGD